MKDSRMKQFISNIIENTPADWLKLTTHRLDIYNEELAKFEFLDHFEKLYKENNAESSALEQLPTAYDYIRLGHPLSSVLEWTVAQLLKLNPENVISFSSRTMPVLAVLRKNLFDRKKTYVYYTDDLPNYFDRKTLESVYGYNLELKKVNDSSEIEKVDGSVIFISQVKSFETNSSSSHVDFHIQIHPDLGSLIVVNGEKNKAYISAIQHVRRRESIAMTPANCYTALQLLTGKDISTHSGGNEREKNKASVVQSIQKVTASNSKALLGSSGLSIQYAIMMGLIDSALEKHPGKKINIIVPPNCYGGTNDQARRVAACVDNVEILDLPVDGDNDMVQSTAIVLNQCAEEDAVPYIIAEIPTNPRVEVPDLDKLRSVLSQKRTISNGQDAIAPVFILDQTFCPNVQFLSEEGILSSVKTISYVSGSKFPSGGKCTAGYCVANQNADYLMERIEKHLILCDNEATDLQVQILAEQIPSMNQRIVDAYKNTREFVNFIKKVLPTAKINFVSEELAKQGFMPSVFSLDLPTKGETHEEREAYKRELNQKLIDMMITQIPNESKYCVSYGQLKGCYWTIPATSTQGTTKESDKDYIARVSLSPDMDMEKHKEVFLSFVEGV
jgi:cystathionine beta-lyase/cystathionine gamma-synthase